MAEERDVVVSAFAVPPQATYREIAMPLGLFAEEPEVVGVDPLYGEGASSDAAAFGAAADSYRDQDGFILRRLLRQRLRGITVRRIALVGFSAGNTFVGRVLAGSDAPYVDTVIALDGMYGQKLWNGAWHAPSLAPWVNFGVRAALGAARADGPMMLVSYTHIASHAPDKVGSTRESAEEVTAQVRANSPGAARIGFSLDELVAGPPPPAVTITVNRPLGDGRSVPITRTWDAMPEPGVASRGNYFTLDYGGSNEADHVFQARYVQGALWRAFLVPRWSEPASCPSPLGQDEAGGCVTPGVLAPPSVYQIRPSHNWPAALAGLALGVTGGYLLGHGIEGRRRRA